VECRFFAGYSETETAEALGVSARTVERDWLRARVWLKRALTGSEERTAGQATAAARTAERKRG
jgi:DNA-directed RNA polymerase specialized sigma24 family protein